MKSTQFIHSSQEVLAIAIRDWILNSGQLVKMDVMRMGNLVQLVKIMQKDHKEEMDTLAENFRNHKSKFNPAFDKDGYLSMLEVDYEIVLTELFGDLWNIIHSEELIPAGLISQEWRELRMPG